MSEQEIKELDKAVSKLSEEDQNQVSGGRELQTPKKPKIMHGIAYGFKMPVIDLSKIEITKQKPTSSTEPEGKE